MIQRLRIALHEVSVRRGDQWALRHVSWELGADERWALIGPNGAGKTQLLKLLATDVWPTPTGEEAMTYRIGRRALGAVEVKRYVAYVGAENQDKYARYGWDLRVDELVATGMRGTDLLLEPVTGREQSQVTRMLRSCGLQRLAARRFSTLSYGQKRLALLARGLVRQPHWLLLDEFYNGLDRHYRRRVQTALAAARRRGQSWVVAAHRAEDIPPGTNRVLELVGGRVRRTMNWRQGARLWDAAHRPPPPARARATRGTSRGSRARDPGRVLLRLREVDLYVNYRLVLRAVNWELRAGEQWAIFGANGAGKSSFLKLIYGDLAPALGGRIERVGFPAGTPIESWKRHVGYVSPELQADYATNVTLFELVASGRHSSIGLVDPPTAADRRAATRWLKFFDLWRAARRRPRELSYGQLRRALIARALASDPGILLLDEPFTGLDPLQRTLLQGLLERLIAHGVTLLIAVHHGVDLPPGITHRLRLHKRRIDAGPMDSAT
jgi:molybdate transport system ATP-binding protein